MDFSISHCQSQKRGAQITNKKCLKIALSWNWPFLAHNLIGYTIFLVLHPSAVVGIIVGPRPFMLETLVIIKLESNPGHPIFKSDFHRDETKKLFGPNCFQIELWNCSNNISLLLICDFYCTYLNLVPI